MPNPSPVQTEDFKRHWYQAQGNIEGELSKKAIAVKLPVDVDGVVRSIPNMAAWLRRVITEAAVRELMKVAPEPSRRDGEV
jgi:hypothetical protein